MTLNTVLKEPVKYTTRGWHCRKTTVVLRDNFSYHSISRNWCNTEASHCPWTIMEQAFWHDYASDLFLGASFPKIKMSFKLKQKPTKTKTKKTKSHTYFIKIERILCLLYRHSEGPINQTRNYYILAAYIWSMMNCWLLDISQDFLSFTNSPPSRTHQQVDVCSPKREYNIDVALWLTKSLLYQ